MEWTNGLIPTWASLSHTHIGCRRIKMKCLEMRAHGHANRGDDKMWWNNMEMTNGLIPTWVSLSHTHIRCRRTKMECLEMRAHGHANRGGAKMIWNMAKMICKHTNGISAAKYGGKQPRKEAKWHEMQGNVPKCNIRHPKWPIAMLNMHNMDMQCKDRS